MFYFNLDHASIAHQVAGLINSYNNLSMKRSANSIRHGKTDYIVETHGKWVLGATGIDRQSYTFTEIKHVVVHPDWRGKGLAKRLVRRAMDIISTRMIYCTVRNDNEASLELFKSCGFQVAGSYPAEDHTVIILARAAPQWEKRKPLSKSKLSFSDAETLAKTSLKANASLGRR
jgi:ribosomal protein S18 acetylase RimI-like enzyme